MWKNIFLPLTPLEVHVILSVFIIVKKNINTIVLMYVY